MSETFALIGRAGSGKDTMAVVLKSKFESEGKSVYISGFADIIKEMMSTMFCVDIDIFYDRTLKEQPHPRMYGMSPRRACQWFGTDVVRNSIHADFWYNRMLTSIKDRGADVNIITDCRFLNEARNLQRDLGARLYYVDADDRIGPMADDAHVSEREVYVIKSTCQPVVVHNNDTIGTFLELVKAVIGESY